MQEYKVMQPHSCPPDVLRKSDIQGPVREESSQALHPGVIVLGNF